MALLIPCVTATSTYEETFYELTDVTLQGGQGKYYGSVPYMAPMQITVKPAEFFVGSRLVSIDADVPVQREYNAPFVENSTLRAKQSYAWDDVPLKIGSNIVGTATIGFYKFWDGSTHKVHWYCWFNDIDLTGYTGTKVLTPDFTGYEFNSVNVPRAGAYESINNLNPTSPQAHFSTGSGFEQYRHWSIVHNEWFNELVSSSDNIPAIGDFATIDVVRVVNGTPYPSIVRIRDSAGHMYSTNYPAAGSNNIHFSGLPIDQGPYLVDVQNIGTGTWFNRTLYDTETPPDVEVPPSGSVTVYVQNSQTGALLANANLAILAAAGGTETEILNTTLPGGTATYNLQPTGGGSPNPDYYRAVATVPGFSQIIENHSFTLNGPHDVIIEMRPDTGGPLDPDRAYLEFYVRDIHANPISSSSVQCDGRIKTTNSQGYAVFEVSKNATYPYVAKKSGYVTIEGTATVADGPRYVANVVLGPGTVPTHTPTLGPGETPGGPGATPTPDTRTNEQKGQAIIDLIADFAEPIAILAIVATVFGLMQMMMPRRR